MPRSLSRCWRQTKNLDLRLKFRERFAAAVVKGVKRHYDIRLAALDISQLKEGVIVTRSMILDMYWYDTTRYDRRHETFYD